MSHPRLREHVRLLVGADDRPLAYDEQTGRYHRLSGSAVATLRMLDGSRSPDEVAGALATARHGDPEAVRAELDAFIAQLSRAGLLDGTRPVAPPSPRRSLLLPRFVVTRALPRLLEPLARVLRPGRRATAALGALVVTGVLGTVVGLGGFLVARPAPAWGIAAVLAAAILLAQVCVHEAAHALVCQVLRVPIRAAGFALLLWLVPVAYVDRTDAYRIRRRGGRVALALAGPLCDGVAMGAAAIVALTCHGLPAAVAGHLLTFQIFTLLINANPLLPSDGYVAVEAAFGLVDPRGRALALVSHAVRRRALPPHLASLPAGTRRILFGYGVACAGYLCLVLYAAATGLLAALTHLIAALGW